MELSFGQRIDPHTGLIQPWFVHGALDEIWAMDLSDKVILMYGAGLGDLSLAKRCKKLYIIERDIDWYNSCQLNNDGSIAYIFRPCTDCNGHEDFYTEVPEGVEPDVLIIDDAYRYECLVLSTKLKRPLIVICDNWMQSYVFMCPAGVELMKDFKQSIHEQSNHTDNDGINKWKTAIFYLT